MWPPTAILTPCAPPWEGRSFSIDVKARKDHATVKKLLEVKLAN